MVQRWLCQFYLFFLLAVRKVSRWTNPSNNGFDLPFYFFFFLLVHVLRFRWECLIYHKLSCPTNYCICTDWVVLPHLLVDFLRFPRSTETFIFFFGADSLSQSWIKERCECIFEFTADNQPPVRRATTIYYDHLPYFVSSYESITHSYQITFPI